MCRGEKYFNLGPCVRNLATSNSVPQGGLLSVFLVQPQFANPTKPRRRRIFGSRMATFQSGNPPPYQANSSPRVVYDETYRGK